MFRLRQILQNSWIRFEGFLYRFFGFFRQFFSFLYQRFVVLLQLLGFTNSGYFLESEEVKDTKSVQTKQVTQAEPDKAQSTPTATRRRPDAKMDYYLNMARPKKASR